VFTKNEVRDMIKDVHTPVFVLGHMLVCLFNRQTSQEQDSEYTAHLNSVGFNSTDASFLSSVAKGFLKFNNLAQGQLPYVRRALAKYSGQLSEALNSGELILTTSQSSGMRQNSPNSCQTTHQKAPKPNNWPPAPEPAVPDDVEWRSILWETDEFLYRQKSLTYD